MKTISKFFKSVSFQSTAIAVVLVAGLSLTSCNDFDKYWKPYKKGRKDTVKHDTLEKDTNWYNDSTWKDTWGKEDPSRLHTPELKSATLTSPDIINVIGYGNDACATHMTFEETSREYDAKRNVHVIYLTPKMHYMLNICCTMAITEVETSYILYPSKPDEGCNNYEVHIVDALLKETVINTTL